MHTSQGSSSTYFPRGGGLAIICSAEVTLVSWPANWETAEPVSSTASCTGVDGEANKLVVVSGNFEIQTTHYV